MPSPRPSSAFAAALSRTVGARVAAGLAFAAPEVLEALGDSRDPAAALPVAAERNRLDFAFVPPSAHPACAALTEAGCEPVAEVPGPLGRTLGELGWADGMRATAQDPATLRGMLDEAAAAAILLVEAAALAGAGAVVVAEDLAGSAGPLVGPDYALSEIFPRLSRIVEAARVRGLPAVLHADGDARAFLAAAARAGFTGLHGGGGLDADRLATLVAATRAAGLAFLGGLRTEDLGRGPMRAIAAGSEAGIAACAGGVLLADDGGMTTRAEASAFVTALEAARDAAERGCRGA